MLIKKAMADSEELKIMQSHIIGGGLCDGTPPMFNGEGVQYPKDQSGSAH